MRPKGKTSTLTTTQVQINARATVAKSAASPLIVKAVQHAHPDGDGSLAMTDRNEFVWVVAHSDLRALFPPSFVLWLFDSFPVVRFDRLRLYS